MFDYGEELKTFHLQLLDLKNGLAFIRHYVNWVGLFRRLYSQPTLVVYVSVLIRLRACKSCGVVVHFFVQRYFVC